MKFRQVNLLNSTQLIILSKPLELMLFVKVQ